MNEIEKLDALLQKSLTEINEYCASVRSSVKFLGHTEAPSTVHVYPFWGASDPLGITVNVASMRKGKKEIAQILAENGILGTFENDGETGIGFCGTVKAGLEVSK